MADIHPDLKRVFGYIDSQKDRYVDTLREAVSIRSVSAQPEARSEVIRMVQWTGAKLVELGTKVELRKIGEQVMCDGTVAPLPPVIYGTLGEDPSKKTVLIYGHLDVQPAKMEDGWNTEPFTLTDIKGKLYGRGSTDDKGPVLGWLHTIEAYQKNNINLPVNIKFCLEAMEESGSEGLEPLLRCTADTFLANVDFVCISDNYWLGRNKPCLTYGLRGLAYFFCEVECGTKDLHSGVFGGAVREAMTDLIQLLGTLTAPDGRILVPGLMDQVAPESHEEVDTYKAIDFDSEEFRVDAGVRKLRYEGEEDVNIKTLMSRWRYPALSLHGIQGCFSDPGSKTVIPRKVIGKFSIRLVPNQTVEYVETAVRDYLTKKFAELKSPNKLLVHLESGGKPWVSDTNHANYRAAATATKLVYGVEPYLTREGGSIPVTLVLQVYMADDGCEFWLSDTTHPNYLAAINAVRTAYGTMPDLIREGGFARPVLVLQEATRKNVLLLPMGASDDGAHSQNEKLDLRNYIEGTKVMAAYLHELGKITGPV